jgi:hypothetical protein
MCQVGIIWYFSVLLAVHFELGIMRASLMNVKAVPISGVVQNFKVYVITLLVSLHETRT